MTDQSIERKKIETWRVILTWVMRVLCGGLFVFSGFVKAIDPWGTLFKIEDYLAAFGFDMPFALLRLVTFALCALEFIVGLFLLLGCFRKSCPLFAALLMIFFLPLSLWIAVENPVPDCGCFGDAWVISNWATFWKNIVLSAGIAWLIRYNIFAASLINPYFQWLAVVASGLFVVLIELIGFFYQPLIDFRNYPIGSQLFSSSLNNYEYGIDVFDVETLEDMNDEAMEADGKELIVMIPKVSMVSPSTTWKLNSLYEWSQRNQVKMIGIVSGSKEEIEEWEDLSMTAYPIFLADDTTIEEVIRGNPGILYIDNGIIKWKTTLYSIDIDDFMSPEISQDASSFARDNSLILRNISLIFIIVMASLIFISFTPRMVKLMIRGGLASNKGVRHH